MLDPTHIPQPGWLRVAEGRIVELESGLAPSVNESSPLGDVESLIVPGFIDAHLHLPQFDIVGCDGLPLLKWLDRVVYPAEMKWGERSAARRLAQNAYARMLATGTLGYAGYLTSHVDSLVAALGAAHEMPIRAIAGQVLMDRNAPESLLGQEPARLSRSTRGRFDASLNPRFAPSCSEALLQATGERARAGFPDSFKQREPGDAGINLFLQTHLAESQGECELVRDLFPDDDHYTGVYDRHGLLGPFTLLAHGVHLADDEWRLIAERGSVVVHCPSANTFLGSGLFDLRSAEEHGVRLALGSDVAAGPDLAMPRVARAMIEVAKLRRLTIDSQAHVPTPEEAWNLITRGNALALDWHDAGRLATGAAADLLVLRVPFDLDRHYVGRLMYTWRDDCIQHRVLNGRHLTGAAPAA